jgi:DNA topoisomerase-3
VEEKRKLYATTKGRFLIDQLVKDTKMAILADLATTTAWEEQLLCDPLAFEASVTDYVKECVKGHGNRESFDDSVVGQCPRCCRSIRESSKNFFCTGYRETPACNFSIWKTFCGAKLNVVDARAMLEGKKTRIKNCVSKEGKKFKASFYLKDDYKVGFAFAKA